MLPQELHILVPTCTYKYQGTSKSKHVTIVNLCSVLCPLFHREWRIKPCVDCAHFLVVNLDVRRCHQAILVSFVILWSEVLICDYMILYGILWWKTFRHFYLFFGEDSNGLHNDSCWWRLHLLNRPWTVHTVDKTTGFQIHIASSLHMNHVCSGFWLPSKNLTVAKHQVIVRVSLLYSLGWPSNWDISRASNWSLIHHYAFAKMIVKLSLKNILFHGNEIYEGWRKRLPSHLLSGGRLFNRWSSSHSMRSTFWRMRSSNFTRSSLYSFGHPGEFQKRFWSSFFFYFQGQFRLRTMVYHIHIHGMNIYRKNTYVYGVLNFKSIWAV